MSGARASDPPAGDPSAIPLAPPVSLEGFHAVKHALRFGAEPVEVVCSDRARLERLCTELAPDLAERLPNLAVEVPVSEIAERSGGRPNPTGVLALVRRPRAPAGVPDGPGPVVLLERPRHLGNLGAAIRVAAAAGAAGLVSVGDADPWHPEAIRGAAGLQFALPVLQTRELPPIGTERLVAVDPGGEEDLTELPADPVLAFGTEREGLSAGLLDRAAHRLRIPMREGVSSLNLATAVAAALYGGGLSRGEGRE